MALTKLVDGERVPLSTKDTDELRDPTDPIVIAEELENKRIAMSVTPWQFRKAINQSGLRDRVEQLISVAPQDTVDGWKIATSFQRLHPMIIQFGAVIPLTDIEMDELFELAITL